MRETVCEPQVVLRMQALVSRWEEESDGRSIFLSCYMMMTRNMLAALDRCEFRDSVWVDRLLQRFAEYYFVALEAYEQDPAAAPRVWQLAHDATRAPNAWVLQKLMLGVNAHINYDLVLTLVELLAPEWSGLSEGTRAERYVDYCHVNEVIGRTIDAVQDQILERTMPAMDIIDRVLGPIDEMVISRLITRWRDEVWRYALRLLDARDASEQAQLIHQVEADALRRASAIALTDWTAAIGELLWGEPGAGP